jgi:hypothetical protein
VSAEAEQRSLADFRIMNAKWRARTVALSIVVIVGSILLYPIWTSPNFGKPQGKWIPRSLPDEANRAHDASGFSLIFPENWEVRQSSKSIVGWPRSVIPGRTGAGLGVEEVESFHAMEPIQEVVFQGAKAMLSVEKREGVFLDRPPLLTYRLQFERNGRKFSLWYFIAQDRDEIPPEIVPYLDSFRIDADGHEGGRGWFGGGAQA